MDEPTVETAFDPDEWLRRNEALRRIARALVRDESRADDVVQSAYLAALERPPVRATAAWFRRVVRSRAFDALRREKRRREAPLEESQVPPAPELARRLELHGVLVRAVGELSEPYQRVVYLRYFDGKMPADIAVELGIPAKTVQTRLHRALAQLRERLGNEYGPENWSRALIGTFWPGSGAALSWLSTASVAGGASIMSKKVVLVVGALGLAVWGVARWSGSHGESTRTEAADVVAVMDEDLAAPAEDEPAEVDEAEVESARAPVEAFVAAPEPAAAPGTGTLVVLATWADDTPAAGVAFDRRTAGGDSGLPARGLDRVVTDEDGVALFEAVEPGPGTVAADRFVLEHSALFEVEAGEETVVEFRLPEGIAVEGTVRDAHGAPVAGAGIWLTTGFGDWLGGHVVATSDPEGNFRLRDVPPVESLGALASGHGRSALVDLEELDTSTSPVRVELVLAPDGGAVSGTVTGPDGERLAGVTVGAGTNSSTEWRAIRVEHWTPLTATTDEHGEYAIVGLPPGEHPLRALAPGLPIWKGTVDVQAGLTVRADIALEVGASVEGTVRDEDGGALPGALVRALDAEPPLWFIQFGQYDHEDTFGYPAAVSDADGRYRLSAVPAGDVFLYANPRVDYEEDDREGVMRAQTVLRANPGDRLHWDPVVGAGRVIEGFVRYRDGAPLRHAFVSARDERTGATQRIRADGRGTFRFVNMADAPHALGIQDRGAPRGADPISATGVWPDGGPVELVASYDEPVEHEHGSVRGRIEDTGGRASSVNRLVPALETEHSRNLACDWEGDVFLFESVVPGRYRPILVAGDDPVHVGEWFEIGPGEVLDLGTLETEPGCRLLVRIVRDEATAGVEPRMFLRPAGLLLRRDVELGRAEERVLDNLCAGLNTAYVFGDGMKTLEAEVTVEAGALAELILELVPAVRRAVEIGWPETEALGSLTIRVEDELGRIAWKTTQPNAAMLERPFTVSPNFETGSYTITAESRSGLRGTAQVVMTSLAPGQPTVKIELR